VTTPAAAVREFVTQVIADPLRGDAHASSPVTPQASDSSSQTFPVPRVRLLQRPEDPAFASHDDPKTPHRLGSVNQLLGLNSGVPAVPSARVASSRPTCKQRCDDNEDDSDEDPNISPVVVLGMHACQVSWEERGQRLRRDEQINQAHCQRGKTDDESDHGHCPPQLHRVMVSNLLDAENSSVHQFLFFSGGR